MVLSYQTQLIVAASIRLLTGDLVEKIVQKNSLKRFLTVTVDINRVVSGISGVQGILLLKGLSHSLRVMYLTPFIRLW